MDKPKTYTLKEVANRVGVSDKTIKRWYLAGKVPPPSRDRNNRPAFTETTLTAIVRYAFQLTPAPVKTRARAHSGGTS